jgi:hypothetical protein
MGDNGTLSQLIRPAVAFPQGTKNFKAPQTSSEAALEKTAWYGPVEVYLDGD